MTKFRPCIDLHDGIVKQIVGGTLTDDGAELATNFVSERGAGYFAELYARAGLRGGHVIMLGSGDKNKEAALTALAAFPGGLQIGGGITPENARSFIDAGASHVVVTSSVFCNGALDRARLAAMRDAVGRDKLVLDLSCRRRPRATGDSGPPEYVVVTDRWQRWTDTIVCAETLKDLGEYAAEFLVHGVDVEGLRLGVEDALVETLGRHSPIPVTYAGGVRDMADLERVRVR